MLFYLFILNILDQVPYLIKYFNFYEASQQFSNKNHRYYRVITITTRYKIIKLVFIL